MNSSETKNINEIKKTAKEILRFATANTRKNKAVVILFSGELGSGKTTLIKEVAHLCGVNKNITSPTFVIEQQYDTSYQMDDRIVTKFIHADMYRLQKDDTSLKAHWEEKTNERSVLLCIEWPEFQPYFFESGVVMVECLHVSEEVRRVSWKLCDNGDI